MFNDSRCAAGGVCSTDSVFITCELKEVVLIRVVLPTGDQEIISVGDTAAGVDLPAGFTAVSLVITEIDDSTRNFNLTLSIANASLLNGGNITCDDTTPRNIAMAGCPVRGKSQQNIEIESARAYSVCHLHLDVYKCPILPLTV